MARFNHRLAVSIRGGNRGCLIFRYGEFALHPRAILLPRYQQDGSFHFSEPACRAFDLLFVLIGCLFAGVNVYALVLFGWSGGWPFWPFGMVFVSGGGVCLLFAVVASVFFLLRRRITVNVKLDEVVCEYGIWPLLLRTTCTKREVIVSRHKYSLHRETFLFGDDRTVFDGWCLIFSLPDQSVVLCPTRDRAVLDRCADEFKRALSCQIVVGAEISVFAGRGYV
jgi:hypothetical protein